MLVLAVDGPERERLEAQVGRAGLRPSVLFTGFLDQPRLIGPYKAADLLLSTSKTGRTAFHPGGRQAGERPRWPSGR
jgi:glycosyltransferase involved in cell wall biosynthesis